MVRSPFVYTYMGFIFYNISEFFVKHKVAISKKSMGVNLLFIPAKGVELCLKMPNKFMWHENNSFSGLDFIEINLL